MRELALFAGAGGGLLGSKLLGWRTVCAVERDAYAAAVLAQRQNDGLLEACPIWSDVTTFDGRRWRGVVDVISGGFPCQDISVAGKGVGLNGERSGLWSEFARIIGEVRPQFVFIENSPALTFRGLEQVLADLAALGLDAEWGCLSASEVGAPHKRDRIWILANAQRESLRNAASKNMECKISKWQEFGVYGSNGHVAYAVSERREGCAEASFLGVSNVQIKSEGSCEAINNVWPTEPDVGRVADGVAYRVDRLKALGNGQVPRVAAAAFQQLLARVFRGSEND